MKKIIYSIIFLLLSSFSVSASINPDTIEYKISDSITLGSRIEIPLEEHLWARAVENLYWDKYITLHVSGSQNENQRLYIWDYRDVPTSDTPERIVSLRNQTGQTDPVAIIGLPMSHTNNLRPQFQILDRVWNKLYILASGYISSRLSDDGWYFKLYSLDLNLEDPRLQLEYEIGRGVDDNYYACNKRFSDTRIENETLALRCMRGPHGGKTHYRIELDLNAPELFFEDKTPLDTVTTIPNYASLHYNPRYNQTNPIWEFLERQLYNREIGLVNIRPSRESFSYPSRYCDSQTIFARYEDEVWKEDIFIGNPSDRGQLNQVALVGNTLYYRQNTGLIESDWTCIGWTWRYYKLIARPGTYQETQDLSVNTTELLLEYDFSNYFQEYETFRVEGWLNTGQEVTVEVLEKNTNDYINIGTLNTTLSIWSLLTERYAVSIDPIIQVRLTSSDSFSLSHLTIIPESSRASIINIEIPDTIATSKLAQIEISNIHPTINSWGIWSDCSDVNYQSLTTNWLNLASELYNGEYLCIRSQNELFPQFITTKAHIIQGIDTSPPVVTFTTQPINEYRRSQFISFSIEDASPFEVYTKFSNETIWVQRDINTAYTRGIHEEVHSNQTLQVRVIDIAGNETITQSNIIYIDRTNPEVSIATSNMEQEVREITLSTTINNTSPYTAQYQIGENTFPYTSGTILTFDNEIYSNKEIIFIVEDQAGNETRETIILGTIDRTPPNFGNVQDTYTIDNLQLELDIDIEYSLESNCSINGIILTFENAWIYTCRLTHRDRAGNEAIKEIEVTIELPVERRRSRSQNVPFVPEPNVTTEEEVSEEILEGLFEEILEYKPLVEVIRLEEPYESILDKVKNMQKPLYLSSNYKNGIYTYSPYICEKWEQILTDTTLKLEFEDIGNKREAQIISSFKRAWIINGVTEATFEPNRAITRAEFLTIALRSHCVEREEIQGNKFEDVVDNTWVANVVNNAYNKGIVKGTERDGKYYFRPNDIILVEEMLAILLRLQNIQIEDWGDYQYQELGKGSWQDRVWNTALFLDIIDLEVLLESTTRKQTLLSLRSLFERY